jgi:hypothetical protein
MNTMNEYYRETDVSIHKREQAKIGRLESIPVNDELSALSPADLDYRCILGWSC